LEKKIVYFANPGMANTEQTLRLARERADELGIRTVVVASGGGHTAQLALNAFRNTGLNLIVVSSSRARFSAALLNDLEDHGVTVIFSADVKYTLLEPMRDAFYKLSEGIEVAVELAMIVAEENLVKSGEEIVAIAGTSRTNFPEGGGADTAIVIEAKKSEEFNKLPNNKEERHIIREIICKPR
jgi:uncharacterized protein